jgi:hypothetical protein
MGHNLEFTEVAVCGKVAGFNVLCNPLADFISESGISDTPLVCLEDLIKTIAHRVNLAAPRSTLQTLFTVAE